ncbi:MAG: hypothetical protein D6702_13085 [Planctomycetota bacterium]|nr:MAG: hypothetical protein D6702_13085 [Planctomycetota bacterium]
MNAVAALRSYVLRRRLGGVGSLPGLAVALVPAGIAAAVAWHGEVDARALYLRLAGPLGLGFVLPFLSMFATLPVFGELWDRGAVGYVFTRPVPRWAPLLGIHQGAVLAGLPAALLAAAAPAAVLSAVGPPPATGWLEPVAAVFAVLAAGLVVDCALCVLLGAWSRRAILWAMFVLVVWGSVVGNLPGSLRGASPHRYLAALFRHWTGIGADELRGLPPDPEPPTAPICLLVLAGITVAALFLAWRAARRRDIL